MNIEEQRKAFEEYFKDKYPELYKDVFNEDGDDRAIIGYSFALSAWLSSASREGYKLVPVEPTNAMAHAGKEIDGRLSAFKCGDIYKAMINSHDN